MGRRVFDAEVLMKTNIAEKVQGQEGGATLVAPGITGRTPQVPANIASVDDVRYRPVEAQVQVASQVASEVSNTAQYRDDFGKRAPDPEAMAQALQRARALSAEVARARAWLAWLEAESAAQWNDALTMTSAFQEHFELAARSDANLALRYPGTSAFYKARVDIAARAMVTRKRKAAPKDG